MPSNLPNIFRKTLITGNLDLNGNLFMNSQNVYLGYLAGNANPGSGSGIDVDNIKNVAIGSSCATYQTGFRNVSIGHDAATNGTTPYSGANNVSIGYNSGFNSTPTSNGVAIGVNSLIDFSGSIAIGSSATARGFRNIAIGNSSTSGSTYCGNSVAIGYNATNNSFGNSVAIGPGATSIANNQITIGTNSNLIAFPGMLNNYGSYKSTTYSSIPLRVNTECIFNSSVYSCNLIGYNNGSFINVSGRPLVIFISYSCSIQLTNNPQYGPLSHSSVSAFITKNNNTGTPLQIQTVVNAVSNSNNNLGITVSAIAVFAHNDTFECWVYIDGSDTPFFGPIFNIDGSNICNFVVF
jgi:hypothetical protein